MTEDHGSARMTAQRSDSPLRVSGRLRVEFAGPPVASSTFALPRQKTWPYALLCAGLFVGFGIPEVDAIRDIGRNIHTVADLAGVLFTLFWAVGWSVAVLLLFAATLVLVFYRDELRVGAGKLEYICRAGPVQLVEDYELARISKVRTGNFAEKGLTNICIDYGGETQPVGRALPEESVVEALDFIRHAQEALPGTPAAPVPALSSVAELSELPAERPLSDGRVGWLSVIFLIGANLVPLVGVLIFGWDLTQIMVLFWAENAVVGFYTLLKLGVIQRWGALLMGPFFVGHFGAFMAIHFMFVYYLFVRGTEKGPEPDVSAALITLFSPLWSAILAIFVSHGVSFFNNFLGRREYLDRSGKQQMAEPYRRVMVMHVTLIFGGMAILALGRPIYALSLLVALKIAIDLHAHLREHGASE
jgi:hypothetical protein